MADPAADVEAHSGGGAAQTAKDLFAGATGGIAQVLLGKHIFQFLVLMRESFELFRVG